MNTSAAIGDSPIRVDPRSCLGNFIRLRKNGIVTPVRTAPRRRMNRSEQRRFVGWVAIFFALCGESPAVCAQATGEPAVYLYQGPDREQRLASGAKQEGVVSIYTSMQLPDSLPLTQAFERKSGLKVSLWRARRAKNLAH